MVSSTDGSTRAGRMDNVISIVVADLDRPEGEKGIFSAARDVAARVADVNATTLAANLSAFCAAIWTAIDAVPARRGTFRLDSFEVTAEVTAGGEIRLMGSVQAQARGGLKLLFTRAPDAKADP